MKPITILICCLYSISAWGQQDLSSAMKLVSSEQYEEAEKVLEELLKKDAANGDIYYYYGEALIKDYLADTFSNSMNEFVNRAEVLFQTGIKQAPTNVLNQVGMGAVVLLKSSDTTKANTYFVLAEAAVPLNIKKKEYTPQRAVILTKLAAAQLYGKNHNFKKALNYLSRAKIINPTDPKVNLTMGDVYIKQNDASNALFNYNQALNKDPKSPLPKIKIGNIYMRVPNLDAARPYFEEAKEIDSTFAPVYRSLGELWTMGGRHDLAKKNFYKYLQLSGNNTPAKIRYGNSLFRSKDFAGALEVIEDVLKVDNSRNYLNRLAAYCCYDKKPQDLEKGRTYMETFLKNTDEESVITRDNVYYARILYRIAKGDSVTLDKAFEQYRIAYAKDESDKVLLAELATNYYYSKRYEDAIELLEMKAQKGQAAKADAMMIARSYYMMKNYPKAEEEFGKIVAAEPTNIEAHLLLARTASYMDPETTSGLAKPKFEAMMTQIGTETDKNKLALYEAYSYMGWYSLQKKEYNLAEEWYDKLFKLDPANKEWQLKALNATALIHYRVKNYVEARSVYQKILEISPDDEAAKQQITILTKVINAERNMN